MKGKLQILVITGFLAIAASAHPLGNFSVNQYSRLEVEKSRIRIKQVLDIAEIPALQLAGEVDNDKDGTYSTGELDRYLAALTPKFLEGLELKINNRPLAIESESSSVKLQQGAGNLPTIRIEWNLKSSDFELRDAARIAFVNRNFADRRGWNEIVVNRIGEVRVFNSDAFGNGATDELRDYPRDSLDAPLSERSANFTATAKVEPADAQALMYRDGKVVDQAPRDRLAELISVPEITPAVVVLGLLIAFGLGALHAMSPGHGKTVVGAYLVGSRGTVKHALFLGLTVTITHTLGVFALGLVTFFASNYVLSERLMPMLGFVSGLLVFYIGISMFKTRLFSALGWESKADHHHHHEHSNDHGDHAHDGHTHDEHTHTHGGHTHSHMPPEAITWRSLLALGISGGLLPCPSALVLMLSAISLGRAGYGLILTTAFSFGLAATLTAVGLIFLFVGKAFGGSRLGESRIIKALPAFSAFVIACVGALICWDSFRG